MLTLLEKSQTKTELTLREQAELLDLAHDAIIVCSTEGVITFWSHGAEQMYGWPKEAAIGKVIHALLRTEFPIPLPEIEAELAEQGRWEGTLSHTRRDGTRIVVASRWAMGRSEPGEAGIVLEINNDITERKHAEEALRESERREKLRAAELDATLRALKEANRRKDEFLATLAHELRNPLAPIRNALELIKCADGNDTLIEQARTLMERQVGQMVRLIDDLLDLSRISRGKIELRKERVDLAVVVQSTVEASRPFIEARSHQLTVTLPKEPIILDADPTRLSQVISNLLNNAAKYTENGGHIWLTAEQQGDKALVSVRDTGIGIAAEHLPHIFEMFSQVAPALERSQGGLGVGLALVRGLVELHGGTIEARSGGIGMGSEFIVRLPVVDGPVQRASLVQVEGRQKPRSWPTSRILVVDDNRDAADTLGIMLGLMGHEIQTAYDGLEAVQAAATFRPDVVLLDIGLPKMNGYEAARRIRGEPWGQKMVLFALTGWGQEEDKRRAMEAGFDHHLTKPVEVASLEKLLAGLQTAKE